MSTEISIMSKEPVDKSIGKMRTRIKSRLVELRISAREASRRAGFNVGYVGDFLEGRAKNPEIGRIMRLYDALEIPRAELTGEIESGGGDARAAGTMGEIPLFAAQGPSVRAFVPFRPAPVGSVPALPSLRTNDDAYAVEVFNEVNAPRYLPGETAYVSPTAAIRSGDFVFIRRHDDTAGIARAAAMDEGHVAVEFVAAPGRSELIAWSDITSMHRIVGSVG